MITRGQGACFYCGQRKSSAKAAEKRRVRPEAAVTVIRAAGVEPLEDFPGTQVTWRCRCNTCGKEIDVWYSSVAYAGNGACYYCSGTMRLTDEEAHAEMLSLGLQPLVTYPGSNVAWRSRCQRCKKIVEPTLCNARKTVYKCRFCARVATDPETALEIMEDAGLTPLVPVPLSVKLPWPARHITCGKRVAPTLDKVTQRKRAPCRHCAKYGFQPNRPGYLYLLVNNALGAGKIGICNEGTNRISDHERYGWSLVARQLLPGHLAVEAEGRVLDRWALLDLPLGAGRHDMPQGGWTETVALVDRDLGHLREDYSWALEAVACAGSV
ncbi:hypothetical protein ACFFWE_17065 [Sphaerisporangium melleum]|uniref:hypothetical protein n=1 Tax=Sphaerisporangium melleum TaxID=321316 RepID=UPI001663809E|nr:hypothetical protein [Sphaerisporangium melleum]